MPDYRRTSHGADAGDQSVEEMPLCALDRARDELRVERYHATESPDIVAFRVVDRSGKVRGFIGFEMDAMELDLPERTRERVQRGRGIAPKPDLRLVG